MNQNHKPKDAESLQQARDVAAKGQEFYGNTAEAASEAGAALQSSWSNAFRGIQEYNAFPFPIDHAGVEGSHS